MMDIEERLKRSAESIAPPETSDHQMLALAKRLKTKTEYTAKKATLKTPFLKTTGARIAAAAIALSAVTPLAVAITTVLTHNIDWIVGNLRGTYVNMEGVTAFGVWNAPEEKSEDSKPKLTHLSYIEAKAEEIDDEDNPCTPDNDELYTPDNDEMIFDEELYDWESDYDWDPDKASVLVSFDEEGSMKEVVYERTNGRGQVRQDTLGNAAMVYSSESFTYVMYVNDSEWEFWKDINFAQEAVHNNGFHCGHERAQTVVIHNATGKVFALKDLIAQVSEHAGAKNYTMQACPTYDDLICVNPMYGNSMENFIQQWYSVKYDEKEETIHYNFVHYEEEGISPEDYKKQGVSMVKRDKFGQEYLYVRERLYVQGFLPTLSFAKIPFENGQSFKSNGNTLVFNQAQTIFAGTDGCMYTMVDGKLQVFGENFTLSPVESNATVSMKGIVEDYFWWNHGEVYHLEDGYLYSMFGQVWKIAEDGMMIEQEKLSGSFPVLGTDCYIIGGEIIALVDGQISPYNHGKYSCDGTLVHLTFGLENGVPSVKSEKIMKASEIIVQNQRMIVYQDELPRNLDRRGPTKYFHIQVNDGNITFEYIAYGDNGGIQGLVKPITEPLKLQ